MSASEQLARDFEITALPQDFAEDPFPVYRALLEHAPLKRFADGSVMLSRWADLDRGLSRHEDFLLGQEGRVPAEVRPTRRSTSTTRQASSSTIRRCTRGSEKSWSAR